MVAAVLYPGNRLAVVLGVFESKEKAEELLLKWGCRYMSTAERYPDQTNPFRSDRFAHMPEKKREENALRWEKNMREVLLFMTDAFVEYLLSKELPAYSSGANMNEMTLALVTIEMNELSFGFYDD
jgi:hypothetical protein